MKKVLISICMAFAATTINAQLVVDSLGRVGIGTETPQSMFCIGASGSEETCIYFKTDINNYGLRLDNHSDSPVGICGGQFSVTNAIGAGHAGIGIAQGGSGSVAAECSVGLSGFADRSNRSVGVLGTKWIYNAFTPVNFAGIYGSETFTYFPTFYDFPGIYAGYFKGKVRVTNGIYATLLSPTASTQAAGHCVAPIQSERGESVTDKLSQVQTVQFLRYDPTKEVGTRRSASVPNDIDIDNMSSSQLDSLAKAIGDVEPERYLSPVQYGLDAEQLKAVYPELVYEDANGNVSINYVEMVPLLVQSINELKKELAELVGTRRGASASREQKAEATGIEETVSDIDIVRMDQNKPNPFSESTVIALNIPAETQTATIFIYDMSGKQVQSLPVSERGETDITVYARDLAAGMYIYTLVADGKATVTRRMIVTLS